MYSDDIASLAAIDPDDLDFHAQRYDSGEMLQRLVRDARNGNIGPYLGGRITSIAYACEDDGADFGFIPNLGGAAQKVWSRLLDIYC